MKARALGHFGGLLLALVVTTRCFALDSSNSDSDPSTASSSMPTLTATAPAAAPIALSYYGIFQGPALSAPLTGGMINTNTGSYDVTSPQNLYNQFKLDYTLWGDVFVGSVLNFIVQPGAPTSALLMQDSGVRIGNRSLIQSGNFSLFADVRLMAPLSPSRRGAGEIFSMNTLQYASYDVPGTKWNLALCGYHTFQVYGNHAPVRDPSNPRDPNDVTLYFAAYATYHFTPAFSGVLYLESYPYHRLGDSWSQLEWYPADIAPGFAWSLTSKVTFTPQVLLYPGNLRWDTIGTIAYLSAKIL